MGTPVEHSSLGPSSWSRWIRCPGSVQAQAGIPDKARFEAAEGTVFHELVADCLEMGFEPEDYVGGGRGLEVDGFFVEYNEEMCAAARDGLDFVRNVAAEPGWELYVETRVDISKWTLPGQFGTADVILVNVAKKLVIVFDWKYGKEPVYPQENEQAQGYCLGAWQTIFGKLFDWDPSGVKVTIIIEQPRVPGGGGPWETTMQRVLEFGQHAKRQAVLTTAKNPPRKPGVKQCRWCRAKDYCGTFAEWNMEMIGLEFDDLDMADETGFLPELEAPEEVTPERRTILLRLKSDLEPVDGGAAQGRLPRRPGGEPGSGDEAGRGQAPRSQISRERDPQGRNRFEEGTRQRGLPSSRTSLACPGREEAGQSPVCEAPGSIRRPGDSATHPGPFRGQQASDGISGRYVRRP